MNTQIMITIAIAVQFAVHIFLAIRSGTRDNSGKTVKAPMVIHIGAYIGSALAVLGAVISLLTPDSRHIVLAVAVGIAILSALFILIDHSLKIEYDKKGFTVKRLFRKEKRFRYEDIDSAILGYGSGYKLTINGKKLIVDDLMSGGEEFLYFAFLRSPFPMEKETLFNGNVLNPWEFLITLLMVPVFATVGFFIIVSTGIGIPAQDEIFYTDIRVFEYTEDRMNVILSTNIGEVYVDKDFLLDTTAFYNALEEQELFFIGHGEWKTPSRDKRFAYVYIMSDSHGQIYASYEHSSKVAIKSSYLNLAIVAGFVIFTWLNFIWVCHILNNAPDHPILMRILVKKSYWNF